MLPSALTGVRSERSGAPYHVISTSSPGPNASAAALDGGGVVCSAFPGGDGVAFLDGSVGCSLWLVVFWTRPLSCARASWSKPTMRSRTTGFERGKRNFWMRCITLRNSNAARYRRTTRHRRFGRLTRLSVQSFGERCPVWRGEEALP